MPLRRLLPLLLPPLALAGCDMVVLDPAGDVAIQQRNLIYIATGLMLLIILPVMGLTVLFAWRYRERNTAATYDPHWDHSAKLELIIWAVPLLIIIVLGAVTWTGTHLLDPYRPLGRLDAARPIETDEEPLQVEVVSLDWKWLFILPEYDVAAVNELALPVDRPVEFSLTSTSVMNTFYVPAMAGMIYTMPGMETTLHAVMNRPGEYEGLSAHYSGHGFSKMRFDVLSVDDAGFDRWVATLREDGEALDRDAYLELEVPTEDHPVQHFAQVEPGLFDLVVNMCVEPGKMCMSDMMAIDARGGLGLAGLHATLPLAYDEHGRRGSALGPDLGHVAAICTPEDAMAGLIEREPPPVRDRFGPLLTGLGLPRGGPAGAGPAPAEPARAGPPAMSLPGGALVPASL